MDARGAAGVTARAREYLVGACHPDKSVVAADPSLRHDCRAIAEAMRVDHATVTTQILALVIESRLTPEGSSRDALLQRKRDFEWMRRAARGPDPRSGAPAPGCRRRGADADGARGL